MIWPDEPVPGMLKFIIWAANTNAPSTPVRGTRSVREVFLTLLPATAISVAAATAATAATGVDINPSDMCIV